MIVLLLAQAIAGPVLPAVATPHVRQRCPTDLSPDEVVVCARDPDAYRLKAVAPTAVGDGLPPAAVRIGKSTLAAEAEQAQLLGGAQSQRLMVRLKVPFGGKAKDHGKGAQ